MEIRNKPKVVRIIIFAVVICTIAVLMFAYLYPSRSVTPFADVIPRDVLFYIGISDFPSLVEPLCPTTKTPNPKDADILPVVTELRERIDGISDGQLAVAGRIKEDSALEVLYVVRINLIEAVYSKLDSTLGGISQAVDTYSDTTIRCIERDGSKLNYALVGRILLISKNIQFIRDSIGTINAGDSIENTYSFQQVCKRQTKDAISFCFINLDLLSRYRSQQGSVSQRGLSYISDLLGNFDSVGCNITTSKGVASICGILSHRHTVIDEYRAHYSAKRMYPIRPSSDTASPLYKYIPHDIFCGITFWTDIQDFWRQSLAHQDIETRKKIKEELVLFNRDVLDKKDLERDLLPLLGPECGIALARVDYAKFGIKPRYQMPVLLAFMELKDKWAGEKIYEMLNYFVANIEREEAKHGGVPPFTITEGKYKDGIIMRVKINGDEANTFGDALSPAIVFYKDAIIFSTFYPLLKKESEGVKPYVEGDFGLFVNVPHLVTVTKDMEEYIAQTIVNNRFRAEIEPEVGKEISAKYDKSKIDAIKGEIRKGINPSQLSPRSSLEKEVSYRFSKHLYDEKIQLIQRRLQDISQTQRYKDEMTSAKDRIGRLTNLMELVNVFKIQVMFEQDGAVFSGTVSFTE